MPRKVRELKADIFKAGAVWRSGKGSHTIWTHPLCPGAQLTLAGNDGDDAKRYQEKDVQGFLDLIQEAQRKESELSLKHI